MVLAEMFKNIANIGDWEVYLAMLIQKKLNLVEKYQFSHCKVYWKILLIIQKLKKLTLKKKSIKIFV